MARGQLLYRDVWEQRPPGIYLTYLAALSAFGWTPAVVAWLDIAASALCAGILYGIARSISGRLTAAAAAALFTVLTMPAWLYGYGGLLERSVCETFIVACIGLSALCAMALRRRLSIAAAFGVGFWVGAAIVYKPNAVLYLPAIAAWAWLWREHASAASGGALVRLAAAMAAGVCALPLLTTIWLWSLGLLPDARTAVVDFNRWYVGVGFTVGGFVDGFAHAVFLRFKTDPLWFAGGIATLVLAWDLTRRRWMSPTAALAVFWGGAAALVIAVNGMRLYTTYFIQALPPLALLAGWWLTEGTRGSTVRRVLAGATLVVMGGLLWQRGYVPRVMAVVAADFRAMLGQTDRLTYLDRFGFYAQERGYSARANEELGAYVAAHTGPDDRIYLFGINGADVYFRADRLTAHRFLRVNFYVPAAFPDPEFTLERVVQDLGARQPAYLIFEELHSESEMGLAVDALPGHPLIRSLLANYEFDTRIEDFTLYRRR